MEPVRHSHGFCRSLEQSKRIQMLTDQNSNVPLVHGASVFVLRWWASCVCGGAAFHQEAYPQSHLNIKRERRPQTKRRGMSLSH